MIRLYADFNSQRQDGSLWPVRGTDEDLELHKDSLHDGMRVLLYVYEREFEVEAVLRRDRDGWRMEPDMSTLRYLDPQAQPDLPPELRE